MFGIRSRVKQLEEDVQKLNRIIRYARDDGPSYVIRRYYNSPILCIYYKKYEFSIHIPELTDIYDRPGTYVEIIDNVAYFHIIHKQPFWDDGLWITDYIINLKKCIYVKGNTKPYNRS